MMGALTERYPYLEFKGLYYYGTGRKHESKPQINSTHTIYYRIEVPINNYLRYL